MESDDKPDLGELIYEFLTGLPETIRHDILALAVMYGCDAAEADLDDLPELLRKQLVDAHGMRKFGAVLRMRAAVDYVMMRAVVTAYRTQSSPPLFTPEMEVSEVVRRAAENMRLRAPLMARHAEDAQRRWRMFCEQHMGEADLMDYQDRLYRRLRLGSS